MRSNQSNKTKNETVHEKPGLRKKVSTRGLGSNPLWSNLAIRTGNRRETGMPIVQRLCSECEEKNELPVQAKLTVGASDDRYEREADDVAERVMRMPVSEDALRSRGTPLSPGTENGEKLQRQAAEEQESELLQMKKGGGNGSAAVLPVPRGTAHQIQSIRGGGRPLSRESREFFEPRFGVDFRQVRLHTDGHAAGLAKSLRAIAFTTGKDIVFGAGAYAPETGKGKRLLAHELTHVLQQNTRKVGPKKVIQRRLCTSKDDPDKIVDSHTVTPNTGISSPGDTVDFAVRFNCEVRGFRSDLEDTSSTSLNMATYPPESSFPRSNFTRRWDGKRSFKNVGTYMVDDGSYRHRLNQVLYAYRYNSATKKSDNLYASGTGLISPEVRVSTRAGAFSNYSSKHYSTANVETVARIIRSEMEIGNDSERRAIAWAVRNQMVRLNTRDATVAQNHFQDAHGQSATDDFKDLAQEVLAVDMGHDTSGGAIKWFSPRAMPSEGQSCAGYDCGGGLITVADTSGVNHRKFAPAFHSNMDYVPVAGARNWYVRFYRLR